MTTGQYNHIVMTMVTKVGAGDFKAKCLALLDEVARTGRELIVTKRGRPVAKVVPIDDVAPIRGSVVHCDDLLAPAVDDDDWNMNRS